jgi:tetratricopeptide (TPR) repeat protein
MKSNNQISNQEVEGLIKKLKLCDISLKKNSQDHNSHYVKATNLFKLGTIVGERKYFYEALDSYTNAINIDKENALYLSDRSKVYVKLGETELAVRDFELINKLPHEAVSLVGMYIQNTLKDLSKLDTVKNKIEELTRSGKINAELAQALQEHAGVTAGLVVQVGANSERLESHNLKIEGLEEKINGLIAGNLDMKKLLSNLRKENAQLKEQMQVNTAKIQNIEGQIAKLCTKEEFEKATAEFSQTAKKIELFCGKIKVLEDHSQNQDIKLMTIDETLKRSNCFIKENIQRDLEKLKSESPVLFEYANNFYWTLSNYLLAYRAISSGLVDGVRDKNEFEKMWDKVGSKVVTALGSVPVVGGLIGVIEESLSALNNTYQQMKFDRKVAKINEVITGFLLEEDLSLAIASGAIEIATRKKEYILKQYELEKNKVPSGTKTIKGSIEEKVAAFENKLEKLLTQVTKISKLPDTIAYKMAVEEVVLFINYIATNDVKLVTNENKANLDKVIAEAFMNNIGADTKQAIAGTIKSNEQQNKKASEDNCIVALINEINYDNELLNHPDLLKKSLKDFTLNQILDMSLNLDQRLVEEAVNSNDSSLVLAGLVSLAEENIYE